MKSMSLREQIISVAAAVLILGWVSFKWLGLGDALDLLSSERERLASLQANAEEYRQELRHYREIADRYNQYANYSLADQEGDPADVFSNYVNDTIRNLTLTRPAQIQRTEIEEIEGVPNYRQILLPVDITLKLDELVRLLETLTSQRILIRGLDIHATGDNGECDLSVKLTLARFVRAEDLGIDPEEEGTAPRRTRTARDSGEENQ